jgi:predicted Zn-dependent peptidase
MSVKITTLPNGFRVATDTIKSVETVALGVWVGSGSRNETADTNGVAHFLEHMAFKGTVRRTAIEIAEEIEAVGGYLNAYTSREITAYYAKVLKEHTRIAVDILSDILQNSIFDEKELEREREVILQEIGQCVDTPDDIIYDYMQETAFPNQAMGRPILGPASIIRTMPREALINYMKTNYHPAQMVLSAAGNIEHEDLVMLAQEFFHLSPIVVTQKTEQSYYRGGDFRQQRELEQLHLLLGFEGTSYHGPDFYNASLLASVLGGGMASRLFQEIREKRGLVYSIHAFSSAYRDGGIFGIYAGTGQKEAEELVEVVLKEMKKASYDITEKELSRSKTQIKASILMGLECMYTRAKRLAQNLLMYERIIFIDEIMENIDHVSLEGLSQFSSNVIQTPLTIAAVGPIPTLPTYTQMRTYL